jgi:diguanylate cyclase (GGDEF)-like protein
MANCFFGGPAGLTHFYPEDIQPDRYAPPVVFTGLEIFNRTVETGSDILPQTMEHTSKITLSYAQSVFTVRFAALTYQIPSGNQYSYKLEGFDTEWSPPRSTNWVTYTNLPPGKYTLLVRAVNHDDIWNLAPSGLEIEITPPWWATWWFRLLVIVFSAGALFSGIQMRFYNIRKANRELEKRVEERTADLLTAKQELQRINQVLQMRLEEITILQQKLREQSIRDPLTGLYNRRYLDEFLPGTLSRARRENACVAFLLIDLDYFKNINDRYGHAAGDAVLVRVAHLFQHSVRESDLAFRYGGEEFLLILPGLCVEEALRRAEEIRQSLESLKFQYESHPIFITASVGLSVYPLHGEDHDTLLNAADQALYEAKASGRNRVTLSQRMK